MQQDSFLKEWNRRAGFVAAVAIINPIILTAYCLFWHRGLAPFEFWLIGMGVTFCICLTAGAFMLFVILTDRRKRFRALRKAQMWEGVMPYDAAKAKAEKAAEAG
jgi:hypothetical protein